MRIISTMSYLWLVFPLSNSDFIPHWPQSRTQRTVHIVSIRISLDSLELLKMSWLLGGEFTQLLPQHWFPAECLPSLTLFLIISVYPERSSFDPSRIQLLILETNRVCKQLKTCIHGELTESVREALFSICKWKRI